MFRWRISRRADAVRDADTGLLPPRGRGTGAPRAVSRARTSIFLLLGTTACLQEQAHSARAAAAGAEPAAAAHSVFIRSRTNVCVTVGIDARIVSDPAQAELDFAFSNSLASTLNNVLVARGATNHIIVSDDRSAPTQQRRFVVARPGDPPCADDDDIHVIARYLPRPDGTPFRMEWRVQQGRTAFSEVSDVDLAADMRAGRIRGYNQRRQNRAIVAEDLAARTQAILRLISIERTEAP
jgi:hypothetical protein